MIVVAHAGHWALNLLYVAPLIVLGGALVAGRIRDWRDARGGSPQPGAGEPPAAP